MTDLQVRCFLEVAEHLNFTNAAKALFISQSNISRQVSAFEEELGLSLFTRNTKGVRLTHEGEILAETLTNLSQEWNQALIRARNSAKKFAGSIRIGCTLHAKTNSYLSRFLAEFHEQRPEIQIIKERNTQKQLIEGLNGDYYDAILIADHDVRWLSGITTQALFYSRVGIAIHRNHPLFRKKDVSLSDFADMAFIRYKPTEIPLKSDYLYLICKNFGFEPHIVEEYEDFEDFLFAIETGVGVSLIYEETEITSNLNLRFIPIEEEFPQKYLPMELTKKSNNTNKFLDDFFKFAKLKATMEGTTKLDIKE
ncbi:LysR family transcriptional regulator [Eubacterium oxidoreducens]|uniref:DNA-binding transcriptional regulator, LysR family n=1 Tax=Eubacterium oxidoreducens TaxID=1732 RepID=A0A1G6C0Y4_EUBOX|nr:LysR family transcriptional regulator [Eubacterium oxidoreducens]SDB26510.1 DNA-binding transcriptional regulator, LysR family [Eubacterium oxidoreducens]